GTHNIVNPDIVRAIRQVKSFRRESQRKVLADFDSTHQSHVERRVIRTKPAIARGARRAVIGEMIVSINVGAGQKIKRMPTVVGNNGTQFKVSQNSGISPRTLNYRGDH